VIEFAKSGAWLESVGASLPEADNTLRPRCRRHTQATQLLANGVDLKTVQDRMGHANGAITLNWYAHAVPENDEKAAQLVGEIFKPTTNKARIVDLKTA